MKPRNFLLIAGEASGDALAAELVTALCARVLEHDARPTGDALPRLAPFPPQFWGVGGPRMAAAGVELVCDLTRYSVIGLFDALKKLGQFRRVFRELHQQARARQPDVVIGVDYGGFNLRFARALRRYVRQHHDWFHPWQPKLVQFVSPQVWASRPGRARWLEETHDLLLSIFPFEKDWYAQHAPRLRVEFVGHPLVDRLPPSAERHRPSSGPPRVVLLPGSREDELRRHWPLVTGAWARLRGEFPELQGRIILPGEELAPIARAYGLPTGLTVQVGGLDAALSEADLALTKSGTITLECAAYGVPAVVFYKTSWPTYWVGRRLVRVPYLAMPNLLAGESVYPEFVQDAATPENLARAATELLRDADRCRALREKLARVIAMLGPPGAISRAAAAIVGLLD